LFSRQSFQWRSNCSHAMQTAIHEVVREQHIDLILVEFAQMAVFHFPPGIPVVLDEHNVEFDLLERMAGNAKSLLRRLYNRIEATKFRREELAACRAAALTLVTSTRDEKLLQQHLPGLRTAVITNGVDCAYFARPEGPRHPDTAVFVGATHYFPNEDGVLFFLREIQHRIRQMLPGFRFQVVGGLPAPAIQVQRSHAVEITGYVDDVRPYMWGASVFVVPLRMGGGTRFKVVEAMAAGVPVVSTRLGAEGIPAVDGRDLLLADRPEEFARAVARVLTDQALAAMLVANGLQFVRQHFDWPVIADRLEAVLEHRKTWR
ncbi:MAG: glycosyltransferase, partial [Magnetococcus sp. WYHC-3]